MYIYEFDRDRNNAFLVADEKTIGKKKHFHNCMEFIYVIESGDAVAHIDGEAFPLSTGQVCAVSCFSTHYYEQSHPGHYIVCLIPRRYFREVESLFNVNSFHNPIIDDVGEKPLLNLFAILKNIANGRDIFGAPIDHTSDSYTETQLHLLGSYLINLCIQHCGLHERHRISSLVADAVRIIESDFKGELTTEIICKKLGCYQKKLSYHFKKTMNMSILNYIDRTRVLEAARLLSTNPQMTVEAVMLESGFKSSRSFLRHFKNIYGCTPTEYRSKPQQ